MSGQQGVFKTDALQTIDIRTLYLCTSSYGGPKLNSEMHDLSLDKIRAFMLV